MWLKLTPVANIFPCLSMAMHVTLFVCGLKTWSNWKLKFDLFLLFRTAEASSLATDKYRTTPSEKPQRIDAHLGSTYNYEKTFRVQFMFSLPSITWHDMQIFKVVKGNILGKYLLLTGAFSWNILYIKTKTSSVTISSLIYCIIIVNLQF
jgi:hypothetical protein